MKIDFYYPDTIKELMEFEEEIIKITGCELVISRSGKTYLVSFDNCWVREEKYVLSGAAGYGRTKNQAFADYARKISTQTLHFDPVDPEKKMEIKAPRLKYERLFYFPLNEAE